MEVGGGWGGVLLSGEIRSQLTPPHPPHPFSTAPLVKRALSGERIHFSVETPHTQSSESCSYATSWYLLPVRPINYSPKYRSQGKETPRMGRQDRAALSQLNERSQIKRAGGGEKGRKTKKGRALLSPLFFTPHPSQPTVAFNLQWLMY